MYFLCMDVHGGCIFALPSLMIFDALGKIRENMENIGKYGKIAGIHTGVPENPGNAQKTCV